MPRMQRLKTGDWGSAVLHLCGAMRDPQTPEIMAWLRRLPPRDRLATMYAASAGFPVIKNVGHGGFSGITFPSGKRRRRRSASSYVLSGLALRALRSICPDFVLAPA